MQLRPYQLRAIEQARAAVRQGHRRVLLSAPTGSGKSVIASAILQSAVARFKATALVVGHRKELIDQFYRHLQNVGITPGILRGQDERTDASSPIQVGTVQTLTRLELPPADFVIVDEAHRCPGDSYARLLEAYPKATVFGLTATPARRDGKPLKDHFDVLVPVATYSELIDEGAILAPIVYRARITPDLHGVRKQAGDFRESDLEDAVCKAHVIGDVVGNWHKHAEGRSTVVFAVGLDHSRELVERFLASGVRARHLDGNSTDDEREQTLVDLETGKVQVVCNVGILCEGWDQPSVKCCIMARPTLSLTLWMQCSGRILRPFCKACGGKCAHKGEPGHSTQAPIILDHSGNVERFGLPHEDREWSLDGDLNASRPRSVYHICKNCYAYVEGAPCPLCGHKEVERQRPVRETDGVLERVDAAIAKERALDPKRAFFDAQVEVCRKKGFVPGYAAVKYKEKFGQWPPWGWSQSAKAAYAADEYWRERVAKRTQEREFWRDRQAAALPVDRTEYIPEPEDFSGIDEL